MEFNCASGGDQQSVGRTMILSNARLETNGYRQEIIEKVVWLMELLCAIADDSYLTTRVALKGGTALNLFHFNLPRLSVDADLNYIGAVDRETMLEERPDVENRMKLLFERMGLKMIRYPKQHAGGKMVWRYPSRFGNQGNIAVDLNFMYRIPLLPIEHRESIVVAGQQVKNLPVLDIHELAAGKLTALLERQTGRDFFDVNELFQYPEIDPHKLRIIFVLYAAMCSKKNMLNITLDDMTVDYKDLKNKLIPVMKKHFSDGFASTDDWVTHMINNVRHVFNTLLPFTSAEKAFIRAIRNGAGIKPELFIRDSRLIDFNAIKKHPALLWAEMKMK